MKGGQDGARTTDTNGLKTSIISMIFYKDNAGRAISGLEDRDKTTRGFNNEATGSLLCPVDMDWADPA